MSNDWATSFASAALDRALACRRSKNRRPPSKIATFALKPTLYDHGSLGNRTTLPFESMRVRPASDGSCRELPALSDALGMNAPQALRTDALEVRTWPCAAMDEGAFCCASCTASASEMGVAEESGK